MNKLHEFFHSFYPSDYKDNWETQQCAGHYGQKYMGSASAIFPYLVCSDGFRMSVQGHFGAYSRPRDDFADEYAMVEIMCKPEPEFAEWESTQVDDENIYGYVPVETVLSVIEKHGGIKSPTPEAK